MKALKKAGISFLRLMSKSRRMSGLTLRSGGYICRQLPDGRWKDFIRSAIQQVKWQHIEFGQVKTKVGNINGLSLVPHLNEFDFDCLIWKQMPYEPEIFAMFDAMPGAYDIVFDIGANVGIFSLYAAKRNEKAKIYSFEPSGEAFIRLTKNISNNKLQNIVAYNAAVSDQTGFIRFFEPEGHLTNGSLDPSFAQLFDNNAKERIALTVSGDLLAMFVKDAKRVLIKIDVEGAETYVLKSLQKIIEKYLPDILLEVLKPYEASLNELSFLAKHYNYYSIQQGGLVAKENFEAKGEWRDYFLQPKKILESV